MNFLKKHYEKLILAVLLTVFILLLVVQLFLWKESAAIQVEKLKQFQDPPPNYQTVRFEDEKSGFMVLEKLHDFVAWHRSPARGNASGVHTDLMQPYPMAVCPWCTRIIPESAFPPPNSSNVTKCPLCTQDLPAPDRAELDPNRDSDGDGIPDRVEKMMGMNPQDSGDGNLDSDADEFSNYEEYLFKTVHTDPKSRPAYHTQFHVERIYRPELPIQVKNIMMPDRNNLQNAMIQFELRRGAGDVKKVGETIGIKNTDRGYRILKIIPKYKKNEFGSVNLSEVVVEEVQFERVVKSPKEEYTVKKVIGGKIRLPMGGKAFERERILLIRTCNSRRGMNRYQPYELHLNSEFSLGILRTGVENYKVIAVDMAKNEIVLLFNGKEKIKVGPKSLISQKVVPPKKKKKKKKQ